MKRLLFSAAVLTVGLTLAATVQASGRGSHGSHNSSHGSRPAEAPRAIRPRGVRRSGGAWSWSWW